LNNSLKFKNETKRERKAKAKISSKKS
jgi:hypothetical protein